MNSPLVLAALFLCGLGTSSAMAGDIYSYIDADGVPHFSNYPNDARYKRVPGLSDGSQSAPPPSDKNIPAHAYSSLIKTAATQFQLDEALLHAVIRVESGYNPNAVSSKGAIGLMQLTPDTAKRYGVINAKDPTENIQGGARYLKDLLAKFGNNLELTLAAYNAGEGAVARHGNALPPYRETRHYVPQVIKYYQSMSGCMSYPCRATQ